MDGLALGVGLCVLGTLVDFALGFASKRDDPLALSFRVQLISIPVSLVVLLVLLPVELCWSDVGYGIAAGVFQILAIRMFFRALAEGTMGVVSGLNGIVHAVIPIAWALTLNDESFSSLDAVGASLAFVAVLVLNASPADAGELLQHRAAARDAVVSGVLFALVYVCLGEASTESPFVAVVAMRISSALFAFYLLRRSGIGMKLNPTSARIAAVSGLATIAVWGLLAYSAHIHVMSIVTVIGMFEPLGIAFLAYLVLHQQLERKQLAGILLAVTSLVLLSI